MDLFGFSWTIGLLTETENYIIRMKQWKEEQVSIWLIELFLCYLTSYQMVFVLLILMLIDLLFLA